MPSVRLIALKAHVYDRHRLTPGMLYDTLSTGDARVLTAAGVARYAQPDEPIQPAAPPDDDTRDATRGTPESPEEPRRRRPYRRRDLVAEE